MIYLWNGGEWQVFPKSARDTLFTSSRHVYPRYVELTPPFSACPQLWFHICYWAQCDALNDIASRLPCPHGFWEYGSIGIVTSNHGMHEGTPPHPSSFVQPLSLTCFYEQSRPSRTVNQVYSHPSRWLFMISDLCHIWHGIWCLLEGESSGLFDPINVLPDYGDEDWPRKNIFWTNIDATMLNHLRIKNWVEGVTNKASVWKDNSVNLFPVDKELSGLFWWRRALSLTLAN